MTAWVRSIAAFVGVMVLSSVPSMMPPLLGQERPLPDPEPFYLAVRANLARSDREQYRFAYQERRSELHTNQFGKLGTEGTVLYQVTPGTEYGVYYRVLVERDGVRLKDERRETIDRRGRTDMNPSVDDVANTLSFQIARRETSGGRDLIVVLFSPKADARPRTRPGKLAKSFKGTIWIDERAKEVVRVEATATDDIAYGLSIIARLNEGTKVSVAREPIDAIWLPTEIKVSGQGRALLFRKLDVDYAVKWFNYKRQLQ